ncbi:helix-turn-helix transcriptional regulator [Indiicoccus explosivorum]|uniref:helix-turn-helix transcriptional regulator n=1 Tax=Indiicoccus explosivorum TaxID=1917864 RepID=UPI000B449C0D|nr:helix-turn-helix domain-containing protein [Indiicoccus explosivorum]
MGQRSDFEVNFGEIKSSAPAISPDLQLVMVVSGSLTIETNSRYYPLEEKDLLVINRNQLYQADGRAGNRVLTVSVSGQYLDRYYAAYRNSRFECYSREIDMGREKLVKTIRKLLAETLVSHYQQEETHQLAIQSNISSILIILARGFKHRASSLEKVSTSDYRLKQIIQFVEDNYEQPITLSETADRFHLSAGYLSRYFKQETGIGFNRFLMEIRLAHAVKDLLYTTKPIAQIAMNNGFPNTGSLAKLFKETYGETLKTYRENHRDTKAPETSPREEAGSRPDSLRDILRKLQVFLEEDETEAYPNTGSTAVNLAIDASLTPAGKVMHADHHLSIGELREVLKEGVRSQLLTAKSELGLKYVGIDRLIRGTTLIPPVETDETVATTSPYYNADFALTFLQKHGFSLFVRVDYQEISEDEALFFAELELFLKHCLNVYGETFLASWHFMFYEPSATAVSGSEMKRVYLKLHDMLKHFMPSARVGTSPPFSRISLHRLIVMR